MTVTQLLSDPRAALGGEPTGVEKRRVLAVVLTTGLVPTLAGVAGVVVLLAGQFGPGFLAFVALVTLLVGAGMAVGSWLLWAGALFALGRLLGGEGTFRSLLFDVGWGFLPRVLSATVGAVPSLLALDGLEPVTVDVGADPQAFGRAIGESLAAGSPGTAVSVTAWVVALLALFASAYLWTVAVEENLHLPTDRAVLATGLPVLVSVLVRVAFGLAPLLG